MRFGLASKSIVGFLLIFFVIYLIVAAYAVNVAESVIFKNLLSDIFLVNIKKSIHLFNSYRIRVCVFCCISLHCAWSCGCGLLKRTINSILLLCSLASERRKLMLLKEFEWVRIMMMVLVLVLVLVAILLIGLNLLSSS